MFKRFSTAFCMFLLIPFFCLAQNNRNYTVNSDRAIEIYKSKLHKKYDFLNGKEYKLYHVNLETSPLFDASFGMEGTIYANGETYSDLILAYDIYKDELVCVTDLFEGKFISINPTFIDSFSITRKTTDRIGNYTFKDNRFHFRKIDFPENENNNLHDGFYEVSNIGDKTLLIHHEALQKNNQGEEAIIHGIVNYEYVQKKILYFDGKYYEIDSKRKFVKLFPEHKKAINKKLVSFGLRFDFLSKNQLIETIQITNTI